MVTRGGRNGRDPWHSLPRLAAGAISVPVTAGFVALGAAAVLGSSLRDAVRHTRGWLPRHKSKPGGRRSPSSL